MSPTITDVAPTITDELTALTAAYRDAEETYQRARDRWQQAIAAAVDSGMSIRDTARIVGVSRSRITPIIARVYTHAG